MMNVIKYIFVFLFWIQSLLLYSQVYDLIGDSKVIAFGSSYLKERSYVDISLVMMDCDLYYIDFSVVFGDMICTMFFSSGTVKKVGNIYYLIDASCGYETKLKKQNENTFLVEKSFYFLNNKIFKCSRYAEIDPLRYNKNDIDKELKERNERELFYKDNKKGPIWSFDPPLTYDGDCGIYVSFLQEDRYKMFWEPSGDEYYLISEGTWTKKENDLLLYDPKLDFTFLMLKRKDNIYRVRFPSGGCSGNYYHRKKDWKP